MVLSKKFYLGSFVGGLIALVVLVVIGGLIAGLVGPKSDAGAIVGSLLILIGVIPYLFGVVVGVFIFTYKMWQVIPPGYGRTTPGKAVGFLFIPFYNYYWVFVAYNGFAKDLNHCAGRPLLSEGLAMTVSVFFLLTAIPYLGILALLPFLIIYAIFLSKALDAVNELASSAPAGGQQMPGAPPMQPTP